MKNSISLQKGDELLVALGIHCDTWRLPYADIINELGFLKTHKPKVWEETLKMVCEKDFFLFCYLILDLPVNHPFLLARCYDVQDNAYTNMLYLWSRDHWKSTLITYALTLWLLINHPAYTTALFSNSKAIAKPHFMLLKRTCENNVLLKKLWSDIFHADARKQTRHPWSEEAGLYFKTSYLKEPAIGYYGLIDSMPTGGHYDRKLIDDLVDLNNIGTQFMMHKVLEAYKMADNLGRGNDTIEQVIGTRYRFGDLYEFIEGLEVHKLSIVPAEVDEFGKAKYDGHPVYLLPETIAQKKKKQQSTYYAQMLQTPLQHGSSMFKTEWLKFYTNLPDDLNYYILSDPAKNPELSNTGRKLDYSVQMLIGAGANNRIYIIDMLRDRIGIKDKWENLKKWHKMYPIMDTGYEEYATQTDREFFLIKMEEERFYFNITPLKGSDKSKEERIAMLADFFMEGKIYLPKELNRLTKKEGVVELVSDFINEEYSKFPMTDNDDMLDTLGRLIYLDLIYPEGEVEEEEIEYSRPSPLDDDTDLECFWGDN